MIFRRSVAKPMASIGTAIVQIMVCSVVFLGLPAEIRAAIYYVATDGDNVNPGTEAQPWRTVQKAADSMKAGDFVIVQPGNYGSEWVATKASGNAGNFITFQGEGMPIIGGFDVAHAYIAMQGFNIRGTNATAAPVTFELAADGCILQSNRFERTPLYKGQISMVHGDWARRPSNIVIHGNTFLDSSANCLSVQGTGHTISSNYFAKTANLVPTPDSDGDLLGFNGSNSRFVGNYVTNWSRPTALAHCDLIQAFSSNGEISTNNLIEGNTFVNCIGTQIGNIEDQAKAWNVGWWTWRNNLFINVEAMMSIWGHDFYFYNNVFYRCGRNSSGPLLFRDGSSNRGSADNCRVINNIFMECGSYPEQSAYGWYGFEGVLTNFQADYNLVVGIGVGTTKTGFQAKDREIHGVNGLNPGFVSIPGIDFRLTAGSPAIGAGTNLGNLFSNDIQGVRRGVQWDIGPFQYISTSGEARPPSPSGLRLVSGG
jgi:hypothetical protein